MNRTKREKSSSMDKEVTNETSSKGLNNEVSSTQSTGDAVSISAVTEEKSPAIGRIISGKLENYVILSHVQECLYGSVMAGVGLTTGDAVAIKSLRRQDTDSRETASLSDLPETPLADVFFAPILHGLKGVSVIREVIGLSDFHFVISDFANGEDLIELLKLYPYGLPESITSIAMRCAAEALAACHSKGVALQDFSLENCLLSCDIDGVYEIKLCDPGQATLFKMEGDVEVPTEYKGCVGKKFRPPEIFNQAPYLSTKVDAWCLGWSTFYFMFAAEVFGSVHPMDEDYQWHLFSKGRYQELFQLCGIDESTVSSRSLDFIVRLLNPDPQARMSVTEALQHPFLTQSKGKYLTRDMLPPQHETREFRDPERFIIQCLSLANDSDKPRLLRIFALQMPILRRAIGADFDKPLAEIEARSRTVRRLLAETGPAIPRRYFTFHLLLFCRRNRPSHGLVKQYETMGRSPNGFSSPGGGESPRLFPLSTGRSSKLSPRSLLQSPLTRRLNGRDTTRSIDENPVGDAPVALTPPALTSGISAASDIPSNNPTSSKRKRPSSRKVALERNPPKDHDLDKGPLKHPTDLHRLDRDAMPPAFLKPSFLLARTVDAVTLSDAHTMSTTARGGAPLQQRQASESFKGRRRFKDSLDRPARNRPSKQPTPLLKPLVRREADVVCCVQDSPKPHRHSRGCLSISLLPMADRGVIGDTDTEVEGDEGLATGPPRQLIGTPKHLFVSKGHPIATPQGSLSNLTVASSLSTTQHKRQRSSKRGDKGSRERDGALNGMTEPQQQHHHPPAVHSSSAHTGPPESDAPFGESFATSEVPRGLPYGSSLITRTVTPLRLRATHHEHNKVHSHASDEIEEDDIHVSHAPAERLYPSSHIGHQQSVCLAPSSSSNTPTLPAALPHSTTNGNPHPSRTTKSTTSHSKSTRHNIDVSTVEAMGSACSSLLLPVTNASSDAPNHNLLPTTKMVTTSMTGSTSPSYPQSSRLTIGVGSGSRIISSRLTNEWPLMSQSGHSIATNAPSFSSIPSQIYTTTSTSTTKQNVVSGHTPPPSMSERNGVTSTVKSIDAPSTQTSQSLRLIAQGTYIPAAQHYAREKTQWHIPASAGRRERQSLLSVPSLSTAPMIGYQSISVSQVHTHERSNGTTSTTQSNAPSNGKSLISFATTRPKKPSSAESSTHRSMVVNTPTGARSNFARLQVTGAVKVIY